MQQLRSTRPMLLRLALAGVLAGAAMFMLPSLTWRALAQTDGTVVCEATCKGGKCTGNKPYCRCSCHWWFGTPVCDCTEPLRPAPEG